MCRFCLDRVVRLYVKMLMGVMISFDAIHNGSNPNPGLQGGVCLASMLTYQHIL